MNFENFSDFFYGFGVFVIVLPFMVYRGVKFVAKELR